jgi:hypothetical protein
MMKFIDQLLRLMVGSTTKLLSDEVALKSISPLPTQETQVIVTVNAVDYPLTFTPAVPPTATNPYRVAAERWPELHAPQTKPREGGPLVQVASGSKKGGKFTGPLDSYWQNYIKKWNSAATWEKIAAPNYGPSQGIDPISKKLKWNYLVWPSGTADMNVVNVLETVGEWSRFETIPMVSLVSMISKMLPNGLSSRLSGWFSLSLVTYSPTLTPWLFHKVCDNKGNPVLVSGVPIVCPLLGAASWLPNRALIKL